MKQEQPTPLAGAAELQRLLQQLGQDGTDEPTPSRDAAREARMAASIDLELADLVRARRSWRRALGGFAAAAAVVALGLGARHSGFGSSVLAISPEPSSGAKVVEVTPSAQVPVSQPATAPVPSSAPRRVLSLSTVAALPSAIPSAVPQSTLAEENQLFKSAAESARKGDVNAAVAQLDELLVNHPASPLAQAALVRKFRLLAKAGRGDDARHEAQRYLAAYPTGFAVSEAQALQLGSAEGSTR